MRPSALIAFTRPAAMSAPEWPPRAPASVTWSPTLPGATGSGGSASRTKVWMLPAHPTVIVPCSSPPSRFTSSRPARRPGSSAFAPSRPCSSETVKRSSSGPCSTVSSSPTAIAAATPMPLSAPSVVPLAATQPSSRTTSIGPVRGSCGLSGSRSQTMSRCDCSTTVGPSSRPADGGTRTTTLPSASSSVANAERRAHSSTCSRTCSSCFGGRGIRVSSRKRVHTSAGSRSARAPLRVTPTDVRPRLPPPARPPGARRVACGARLPSARAR